jgi:hypothetical protein
MKTQMNHKTKKRTTQQPLRKLYARYPRVGRFGKWDTEGNSGFIECDGERIFARISGRQARERKQLDLAGKTCLFAVGTDPYDYARSENRRCAITWILEEDIDGDLTSYEQKRKKAIKNFNEAKLRDALAAKWYIKKWKKGGYTFPEEKLDKDDVLQSRISAHEANISSAETYLKWLRFKQTSPYIATSQRERKTLWAEGIESLQKKDAEFFYNYTPWDFLKLCDELELPDAFVDRIIRFLLAHNATAIDIESDGDTVFQIGWADDSGIDLSSDLRDRAKVVTKIREVESVAKARWLVGHNLHLWDIPILRKYKPACFQGNPVWDTLLISWMLAPWKRSHALTSSERSHQADFDAQAAFQLFSEQLQGLPLDFFKALATNPCDSIQVISQLGNVLGKVYKPNYPEIPEYLAHLKGTMDPKGIVFLPEWRLSQCAWCPSIRYQWPTSPPLTVSRRT